MSQEPAWRAYGAVCCLCHDGIEARRADPVELRLWIADSDATQTLYAHHARLRGVAHPGIPLLGEALA